MRLALAAIAAISLAACSKPAPPADAAAAPAADSTQAAAPAPPADASASGNAAVKASHTENAGPAAAGANSFTEGQAKEHILNSGYTNVTDLIKDDSGVWHGKATKGGQTMNVSLDFKGNVVTN